MPLASSTSTAAAQATLELCREAAPAALAIAKDLTHRDGPEDSVREIVKTWGRLDILVNNAGYGGVEAFLDMTSELWDRTLAVNLKALALCCAAAGRAMRDQRSGRIVNITSPASRMALPDYTAYAASKAGVDAVTRSAAIALAPHGVTVNSVAPGMMDTEMQRSTEADLARLEGRDDMEAFLAERTRRVPLGRRVDIDVVASAVVWLALDAPDYVTAEQFQHRRRPPDGILKYSAAHRSSKRPICARCVGGRRIFVGISSLWRVVRVKATSARGWGSPICSRRYIFMSCAMIRRI